MYRWVYDGFPNPIPFLLPACNPRPRRKRCVEYMIRIELIRKKWNNNKAEKRKDAAVAMIATPMYSEKQRNAG